MPSPVSGDYDDVWKYHESAETKVMPLDASELESRLREVKEEAEGLVEVPIVLRA